MQRDIDRSRSSVQGGTATSLLMMVGLLLSIALTGCNLRELVEQVPELPAGLPEIPGLPADLTEIPDMLDQLDIPDLASLVDIPGLETLPTFEQVPGTLTFQGPIEMRLRPGETLAGTDIGFVGNTESGAEFTIAGFRSVRAVGDSLDYDGQWNGSGDSAGEIAYHLRARIYQIGETNVRVAGVHQLIVSNSHSVQRNVTVEEPSLRFPYTVAVDNGASIDGITYGYEGEDDRGAILSGLAGDEYPYRKVGDSIVWEGEIHPSIGAKFNLRMLRYDGERARVGGVVTLSLPE